MLFLMKLANELDSLGYTKESNFVDRLIKRSKEEIDSDILEDEADDKSKEFIDEIQNKLIGLGSLKLAEANVVLVKLYGAIIMKKYLITIRAVTDTTKIIGAKKFYGGEEQIPLAKQYLNQLIKQYPRAKVGRDLNPPLTPQMFGLK